ncbi:MAG: hypothetical protein MMC23_002521 [Stictis urceolatum]|nr:hypothetical protein [Stictis urceolata]
MPYPPQGAANNVDVELADSQTINGDAVRHGDSEGSSVATPSGFVSFSAPDPTFRPPQRHIRGRVPQKFRAINEYADGYPRLAAYEDIDSNLLICRKFGWLHNRVLLHHQDELTDLEEELERLDDYDREEEPERLWSRRRDDATNERRRTLLGSIEQKLEKYDELVLRIQQMQSIRKPTKRNQTSLYNLIRNRGLLAQSESEWIQFRDDLAALGHEEEHGRLNGLVEDCLRFASRSLSTRLFRTKSQNYRTGNDEQLLLLKRSRIHALIYGCLAVLATLLLLVPVALLYNVETVSIVQIVIIFAFVLAFSASCAVFTNANVQEIFAATAAYAAVLVVFLGNTSQIFYVSSDGSIANISVTTQRASFG